MSWTPEQIAGQLAEIANEREAMQKKYGDQSHLPLERHLAIAGEGLGKACASANDLAKHVDRVGGLREDEETLTFLRSVQTSAIQTMASLTQLVDSVKRHEASL